METLDCSVLSVSCLSLALSIALCKRIKLRTMSLAVRNDATSALSSPLIGKSIASPGYMDGNSDAQHPTDTIDLLTCAIVDLHTAASSGRPRRELPRGQVIRDKPAALKFVAVSRTTTRTRQGLLAGNVQLHERPPSTHHLSMLPWTRGWIWRMRGSRPGPRKRHQITGELLH